MDKREVIAQVVPGDFWAHSDVLQKEKNLLLEEKITTLQQENEDLHARGRNQMVVSR